MRRSARWCRVRLPDPPDIHWHQWMSKGKGAWRTNEIMGWMILVVPPSSESGWQIKLLERHPGCWAHRGEIIPASGADLGAIQGVVEEFLQMLVAGRLRHIMIQPPKEEDR